MIQLQYAGTARRSILAGLILCGLVAARSVPAASRLTSPSVPLVSSVSPAGWSAGAILSFENRELNSRGTLIEVEGTRAVAEVGVDVLPFLQLAGQAGWATADLGPSEGENGLAWGVATRANLGELVLDASPEIGRRRWLGARLDLAFRSTESNQLDQDFSYQEWEFLPHVVYLQSHRGNPELKPYHANGVGLRAGLVFSSIDGDLGNDSLEENRNFGGMLGLDARWRDGWVGTVQANLYGSSDQTIRLGLLYHF